MTYEQMTWTCETCGERIVGVEQGWVEWLYAAPGRKVEEGEPAAKGMRLVHARPYSPLKLSRTGCQYDEMAEYEASGYSLSSLELAHLMGPDGLMRLLSLILSSAKVSQGLPHWSLSRQGRLKRRRRSMSCDCEEARSVSSLALHLAMNS